MPDSAYRAYLLRMQRVGDGIRPKWTFTVQDTETLKTQTFQSLGALMLFIEQHTVEQKPVNAAHVPEDTHDHT